MDKAWLIIIILVVIIFSILSYVFFIMDIPSKAEEKTKKCTDFCEERGLEFEKFSMYNVGLKCHCVGILEGGKDWL